jgi:YHS domain-containing protein
MNMKTIKSIALAALTLAALAPAALAGDTNTAKPYPLTTCPVSGEKLGEMGAPYVFTYEGKEVRLCCPGCLKDFKKDPATYLKKLEAAETAAKK